MSAVEAPTRRHIAPLDGIRAVAISLVVCYHLSGSFTGGVTGVDVFFALSGFLITGILLREIDEHGAIRRVRFYWRRFLRLGPALIAAAAVTLVLSVGFVIPSGNLSLAVSALAALTYTTNFVHQISGENLGPFSHTWTLAIEEQFYLVWPLLLAWPAFRKRILTIVPVVIIGFVVFRAALSAVPMETELTSHADELLLGALLAAALRSPQHRAGIERWAAPVALPLVAGLAFAVLVLAVPADHIPFLMAGGYTAAAALTVVVIAHVVVAPTSLVSRLLSLPPLVAIGRVSYGIYLYHFPILYWAIRHQDSLGGSKGYKVVGLLLTAAVTTCSWFVVEQPALRYKDRLVGRAERLPVT